MKIVHINGVFKSGSTGAIISSINDVLKKNNIECVVCYGIGPKRNGAFKFCYRYEQALYRRVSKLIGLRYGFAPFSTLRLINFLKKSEADIVHLHSINGNCVNIHKLLKWLKKNNIPTIITNHAEFFYTGNCTSTYGCKQYKSECYMCQNKVWATDNALIKNTHRAWKKMRDAFCGFKELTIVSVSPYGKQQSRNSPILKSYVHEVILNGVNTSIFYPSFDINIRDKLGIRSKKIYLFVTSEFSEKKEHLKGGYYLLKLAENMLQEDCMFIVIGSGNTALSSNYSNIIFIDHIEDKKLLACYYSQADILLSLSKSETFGMTCAEALCCGTPVVGFRSGGPESIVLPEYSYFTRYGDINDLEKHMHIISDKCKFQKNKISVDARQTYDSNRMATEYLKLYRKIYKNI